MREFRARLAATVARVTGTGSPVFVGWLSQAGGRGHVGGAVRIVGGRRPGNARRCRSVGVRAGRGARTERGGLGLLERIANGELAVDAAIEILRGPLSAVRPPGTRRAPIPTWIRCLDCCATIAYERHNRWSADGTWARLSATARPTPTRVVSWTGWSPRTPRLMRLHQHGASARRIGGKRRDRRGTGARARDGHRGHDRITRVAGLIPVLERLWTSRPSTLSPFPGGADEQAAHAHRWLSASAGAGTHRRQRQRHHSLRPARRLGARSAERSRTTRTLPDYLLADKGYSSRANRELPRPAAASPTRFPSPAISRTTGRVEAAREAAPLGSTRPAYKTPQRRRTRLSASSNTGAAWHPLRLPCPQLPRRHHPRCTADLAPVIRQTRPKRRPGPTARPPGASHSSPVPTQPVEPLC